MRILYKIPSRQRPDKLLRLLNTILNYGHRSDYSILISLDEDDPQIEKYINVVNNFNKCFSNILVIWGVSESKIHACNRDMEKVDEWDICVLVSDDMIFERVGFDLIIIELMKKYFSDTDGVLHFPDTQNKSNLIVMNVVGRVYYGRFNYHYHPSYKSMFADNEFTDVARILNKYVFCPYKIFDQLHHLNGKAEKDELYIRNDNMNLYIPDNQNYIKRKAIDFELNIFQ